jgi:hypothetical protein
MASRSKAGREWLRRLNQAFSVAKSDTSLTGLALPLYNGAPLGVRPWAVLNSNSQLPLSGGNVKRLFVVFLGLSLVVVIYGTSLAAAQDAPKEPIVMKDAPNGAVTFDHKKHATAKCEVCHHASKPEKAAKSPQQACRDCHTKAATAPMKTKRQAAFHNPAATAGVCIDCHKKEAAAGKKPPVKCAECHKKAA